MFGEMALRAGLSDWYQARGREADERRIVGEISKSPAPPVGRANCAARGHGCHARKFRFFPHI